ncbi:MAG: DNA polymerase I [Alphaproteobacteria bacterium]
MEAPQKTLCLVDGSGYIFRAFYALPPMIRSDGIPVGAVYGFSAMMMNLLQENASDHIVVVFDAARHNFRNEIYPEYKANRRETPPDLIPQFPLIREACEAMNVAWIEKEGYEADDLIATLAHQARKQGMKARVISADKDLMQLMDDNTSLYDPMKKKEITLEDVLQKFGVAPDKVTEVQALMGDSTDNIPGASGVGPKTAAALIQQFGSIQNMFEHLGEISSDKRRAGLLADKEKIEMSQKLVLLDKYVPLKGDLEAFKRQETDPQKLISFLSKNNFQSLVKRIHLIAAHFNETPSKEIQILSLTTPKEVQTAVENLSQKKSFSFYLNQDENKNLSGISLADENQIYIIKKGNTLQGDLFETSTPQTISQEFLKLLAPLFGLKNTVKIGYDIKACIHLLAKNEIVLQEPFWDVMLMSYDLDGSKHSHDLETLKGLYFPNEDGQDKEAFFIHQMAQKIKEELIAQNEWATYEDIDAPLIRILADMEKEGILLNEEHLKKLEEILNQRLENLSQQIHTLTGEEVNINSPAQLGVVLFEKRGLKGGKRGPNGHWVTDVKVLEQLADEQEDALAQLILEYRKAAKLKSTYIDALLERIKENPRVSTTFSLVATNTGRLASANPNLQNIPVRTEEGKEIRESFIAKEGCLLLSADYSQIELRLIADVAKVVKLRESFLKNEDIHARTASEVLGLPLNEITADLRRQAKAINFGIIYGISGFGLARNLKISRTEANRYIDSYFAQYPEIKEYMKKTIQFATEKGYIKTPFGRKIYIEGLNAGKTKSFAERAAINAPIQGGAADIIKMAMIRVQKVLNQKKIPAKLLLQIHDELVFEVAEEFAEEAGRIIKENMEQVVKLSVPLVVEVGIGKNWRQAH